MDADASLTFNQRALASMNKKVPGNRNDCQGLLLVPRAGLEPAHLAAHAPETCASTNSATWACGFAQFVLRLAVQRYYFFLICKRFSGKKLEKSHFSYLAAVAGHQWNQFYQPNSGRIKPIP